MKNRTHVITMIPFIYVHAFTYIRRYYICIDSTYLITFITESANLSHELHCFMSHVYVKANVWNPATCHWFGTVFHFPPKNSLSSKDCWM